MAERVNPAAVLDRPGSIRVEERPVPVPGLREVLVQIAALAPAGTAVLVGMSAQGDVRLPLSLLQTRELVVTGTFRYANCYPAAIALAASGAVPLASLIDAVFGLREAQDALQATSHDPSLVKVVVHPLEEVR
jgi:L-iditol 2-dehydrogenase